MTKIAIIGYGNIGRAAEEAVRAAKDMELVGVYHHGDDLDAIDVVIIPGVAFTRDGKRLGRGKGYYDRFLPKLSTAYRIGVCYDFQLSDTLPTESYDQKMDLVISP